MRACVYSLRGLLWWATWLDGGKEQVGRRGELRSVWPCGWLPLARERERSGRFRWAEVTAPSTPILLSHGLLPHPPQDLPPFHGRTYKRPFPHEPRAWPPVGAGNRARADVPPSVPPLASLGLACISSFETLPVPTLPTRLCFVLVWLVCVLQAGGKGGEPSFLSYMYSRLPKGSLPVRERFARPGVARWFQHPDVGG